MKKTLFNTICIIGVGLIGGSLGLAIKKKKLANTVVGVIRRRKNALDALKRRAIDIPVKDLEEGVHDADLVILCSPVSAIMEHLKIITPLLNPKALVIDVGSTKYAICHTAEKYLDRLRGPNSPKFVGCHPMAGSEKKGVKFSSADMFKNTVCFVSRNEKKINIFWNRLGAHTIKIPPATHDDLVADISHLPHILAFSLFQNIPIKKIPITNPSILAFARLAKSDPFLWTDIISSNREGILKSLKRFQHVLDHWANAIGREDRNEIDFWIRSANKYAPTLLWGNVVKNKSH